MRGSPYLVVACVLATAVPACGPSRPRTAAERADAVAQAVETRRDEFTGSVSHVLEYRLEREAGDVNDATLLAMGTPGATPVLVSVTTVADSWHYLRCDSVHVLADGAPVSIESRGRTDGTVGRGYVIEHVGFALPWTSVVQIASARLVRIRICNDIFAADEVFTGSVGELARRMYADEPTVAAVQ